MLTVPEVHALAARCAPVVAPATMLAVAAAESGFNPLAIGVNHRPSTQVHPASKAEAVATAKRLIARGANFDLGLGQINVSNLASLRLSVSDAFDPCRNLAASAQVIAAGYRSADPQPGAEQAALLTSLSLYNTGDVRHGFANGYVAKVTAAAERIAPSLQGDARGTPVRLQAAPPAPAWDVFANAQARTAGFVFTPATSGDGH